LLDCCAGPAWQAANPNYHRRHRSIAVSRYQCRQPRHRLERAIGDFATGSNNDILFQSSSGTYALWDMSGTDDIQRGHLWPTGQHVVSAVDYAHG
jgi:hypothetical protein